MRENKFPRESGINTNTLAHLLGRYWNDINSSLTNVSGILTGMRNITRKQNLDRLNEYKKRYLKQKQFPAFPSPYVDRSIPIKHTGYLLFIRSKFLFLGFLKSINDKNLYASYSLIKSYWENVAAFGYYYLRISRLISENKKEEAYKLSVKMGLGGRGFVTEEMAQKKGEKLESFILPNILTMMETVDKDWQKKLNDNKSIFRDLYDSQIAEGGHTTFIGLSISQKKQSDKSVLPDIHKSWTMFENSSIINLAVMSSMIFFYYWEKFLEIKL